MKSEPKAEEWTGAPQMDTGAPVPSISFRDDGLYVAYALSCSDERYAIVRFNGVLQHIFGYPNDEALGEHPLYKAGLQFYAFNEIKNSPYVWELAIRNARAFPGSEDIYLRRRHWIVTFHDETLEVIGEGVEFLGVASVAIETHVVQQRTAGDARNARLSADVSRRMKITSTEQAKGEREVEIFQRFVAASNLPIDLRSIEKREPPEPDILCVHGEHGHVAFELVEICDPNMATLQSQGVNADGVYLRTADPSAEIIARKLRRSYQTAHPIELLCYTDGRVVTPATTIIPTIQPHLQSWRNVFRRTWLFSRGKVHDVWSQG